MKCDPPGSEHATCYTAKSRSACPLIKLVVTRGYGHWRIINSASLWQLIRPHPNYEHITANILLKCCRTLPLALGQELGGKETLL
jgi:hypothetical protein